MSTVETLYRTCISAHVNCDKYLLLDILRPDIPDYVVLNLEPARNCGWYIYIESADEMRTRNAADALIAAIETLKADIARHRLLTALLADIDEREPRDG